MYFGTPENPTQPYPGLLGGNQAPSTLFNGAVNSQDLLNLGIGLLSNSTQSSGVGLGKGLQYMQATQQQRQQNERDNQQLRMQQSIYQNQMDQYNRQKAAQNSLADLIGHPSLGVPYAPGTGLAGGQINQQQFNQQAAAVMAKGGDINSAFSAAQPFMPFPTGIMTDRAKNAILANKQYGSDDWNNYLLYGAPAAPATVTVNGTKYLAPPGEIPNTAGTGTVPISDKLTEPEAGKLSALQTAQQSIQKLKGLLLNPDGSINKTNLFTMTAPGTHVSTPFGEFRALNGIPWTEGRSAYSSMNDAITAIALSESPRLTDQHTQNVRDRFGISESDSPQEIAYKLNAMEKTINQSIKLTDPTGKYSNNSASVQQSNSTLSDPAQASRLDQLRRSQGGM